MFMTVTCCAQSDQVLLRVIAVTAAKLPVVNFEAPHRAAFLTSPSITLKDPTPQLAVGLTWQLQPCPLWENSFHQAVFWILDRNVSFCGVGRNL